MSAICDSIVPSESQIGPLRTSRNESGFRNVYLFRKAKSGAHVFCAKVKRNGKLRLLPGSHSTQPQMCAAHVARWYEGTFGEKWRAVLASRKHAPWQARRSQKYKGYVCAVWTCGAREEVVELRRVRGGDRWRRLNSLAVFATRDEALKGIRRYMIRVYGLYCESALWRAG